MSHSTSKSFEFLLIVTVIMTLKYVFLKNGKIEPTLQYIFVLSYKLFCKPRPLHKSRILTSILYSFLFIVFALCSSVS